MRALATVGLVLAMIATACGDTAAPTTVAPTTAAPTTTAPAATTAPVTTTTTDPATTTTAQVTTSSPTTTVPTVSSRCAGVTSMTLPGDVADLIRVPGSFDGDPQPVSIMETDGAILFRSAGAYWIGFSLNIDYVVFRQLPASLDSTFVPEIFTVVDFGAADDGALVEIDRSLAGGDSVYAFFFLDGSCMVAEAGTSALPALEFPVGGGAAHREGLTCVENGVFATTAGDGGSGMWDVRDHFYAWTPTGPGFTDGFEDGVEAPDGDPAIDAASALNC